MAYADFEFYKNVFLGNAITESEFTRLEQRASEYIDMITSGKAKYFTDVEECLKKACCAVAEEILKAEKGGTVSSETVGKYTVSYGVSQDELSSKESKILRVCKMYLGETGLLYRGGV